MIAIIDYGMGNLRSVQKGFEKTGWKAEIVRAPEEVLAAPGVVLPGVGAFADAMQNLRKAGLAAAIREVIARGRPFLGICLGMQLLFEASEEWGFSAGLAVLPGVVKRLPGNLKIPHMGLNSVFLRRPEKLLKGIPQNSFFYFVHSYYVETDDENLVAGVTSYGLDFPSLVTRQKIFGLQFHPEKSSALGLLILKNFGELVAEDAGHSGN
ncbi:MAG: imidazole glycerol phosphate synthase subunit HisH [Desulfotomaculales bacterium]